jgi:ribonuclease E
MLIDASHPEETRVVVVRGNKVEEFDFESANRKQLRGNIYLAKVTRVEPSLQAAFVEYGGNRQGFLAFNEIHPDYYQIPVADLEILKEEMSQAEQAALSEEERRPRRKKGAAKKAARDPEVSVSVDNGDSADALEGADSGYEVSDLEPRRGKNKSLRGIPGTLDDIEPIDTDDTDSMIEHVGGTGDAMDDIPERPRPSRRQYKIQEVIKRRQLLLVQVVKEERGNKGAALTTYLSLAGRYSVLMPNTGRGGGISRKITNSQDRKRLKEIAQELEVPAGMGVILRTAGASRTRTEIKRDFEYLMRLWLKVRELTMESSAPLLVYEEGSLIKRAIRDLYNKDIGEILVSGDDAYREAKDFMRMLMPSHARAVQPYKELTPIFARYNVESQLDAMFSNQVQLKSGGYLVINPTEALVSIDVNSGRSTREHNIEDTAIRTNLEAAEEVARQLRLRDLAGLIVIDFIDMEEKRNNRAVEKRLAECLKSDRARIQLGRISPFGLMEMSRQRIRTGVLESSSVQCSHCGGTGFLRSTPSAALHVLRSIEEMLIQNSSHDLLVQTHTQTAFYILNQKRNILREFESRFNVTIIIEANDHLAAGVYFTVEKGELAVKTESRAITTVTDADLIDVPLSQEAQSGKKTMPRLNGDNDVAHPPRENESDGSGGGRRRKRRRRGRNGRRDNTFRDNERNGSERSDIAAAAPEAPAHVETTASAVVAPPAEDAPKEETAAAKNRRSGRRSRKSAADSAADSATPAAEVALPVEEPVVAAPAKKTARKPKVASANQPVPETIEAPATESPAAQAPEVRKPAAAKRTKKSAAVATSDDKAAATPVEKPAPEPVSEPAEKPAKPRRASGTKKPETDADSKPAADGTEKPAEKPAKSSAKREPAHGEEPMAIALTPQDPTRPKRAGWWSKRNGN